MVGRGTRIHPQKENLLILDFLWLHSRLKIVHPASLISKSDAEAEEITKLIEDKSAAMPGDVAELIPIDLCAVASEAATAREDALRKRLEAMANRKAKFVSAEEFAIKNHKIAIAEFEPTMKWHSDPMTPKQMEWVEKAGVNIDTVKGKGHASIILDAYFGNLKNQPASSKQKWAMRQAGWVSTDGTRDAGAATQSEARIFFAGRNK